MPWGRCCRATVRPPTWRRGRPGRRDAGAPPAGCPIAPSGIIAIEARIFLDRFELITPEAVDRMVGQLEQGIRVMELNEVDVVLLGGTPFAINHGLASSRALFARLQESTRIPLINDG